MDYRHSDPQQNKANDLRLRGNQAFGAKDYKVALKLYRESLSVVHEPTPNGTQAAAKTFCNIVACLCKLGNYEDAQEPAERATTLHPQWGKAWWRRGIVAQGLQQHDDAISYFSRAVDLAPQEPIFRKALLKCQTTKQRQTLGMTKKSNPTKPKSTAANGKGIFSGKLNEPKSKGGQQPSSSNSNSSSSKITLTNILNTPAAKALQRVAAMSSSGNNNAASKNLYVYADNYRRTWPTMDSKHYPKAWQYWYQGAIDWYGGMMCAIGQLSVSTSRIGYQRWDEIPEHKANDPRELPEITRQFGGIPTNDLAIFSLVSGLAHLGGNGLFFEKGDNIQICPPGEILRQTTPFGPECQVLGVVCCIDELLINLVTALNLDGTTLLVSKAVAEASANYYSNLNVPIRYEFISKKQREQHPSPSQCVEFVKARLCGDRNNKKKKNIWDQMRRYISLMYRGTILWAYVTRCVTKKPALAYEYEQWAIDFIDLADREFSVTTKGDYEQKGSAFRYTLRIGVLQIHLTTLQEVLRKNESESTTAHCHTQEDLLDLALAITEMAHHTMASSPHKPQASQNKVVDTGYEIAIYEYANHRKPMAVAHSTIAQILCDLEQTIDRCDVHDLALRKGLVMVDHQQQESHTNNNNLAAAAAAPLTFDKNQTSCDPFALVAKHFGIAAENSLLDDDETSILWWKTAYAMCLSDPNNARTSIPRSNFTMGELRKAIGRGEAAESARDVDVFGYPKKGDGSFEKTIARRTMDLFRDRDDSFVLPKVELIRSEDNDKMHHLVVDGEILCRNFLAQKATDSNSISTTFKDRDAINPHLEEDKSVVVEKQRVDHNPILGTIPPSLETLCIREPHESGCDHDTKGEINGGATLPYRATMANTTTAVAAVKPKTPSKRKR